MLPLWDHRINYEKAAYKSRINVALHHVENSNEYKKILNDFESLIKKQIKKIANHRSFDSLLLLSKAKNPALINQITVFLGNDTAVKKIDLAIYLQYVGEAGGQAALDKLSIEATFVLENKEVLEYFEDSANLILDSVDETTKDWIANQIQAGKKAGLNPKEIASVISEQSTEFSVMRAERIVLTETAKALIYVEKQAAESYGIEEMIWRTSKDDRVDEICKDLEGKKANIKGVFPGGYEGPPAHVNCRCFIEEVIPESWELPDKLWLGE